MNFMIMSSLRRLCKLVLIELKMIMEDEIKKLMINNCVIELMILLSQLTHQKQLC